MLWEDAGFIAAYEARLGADDSRHVRRAGRIVVALRQRASTSEPASLAGTALAAMRVIVASLGDHVESAIGAFEHACAHRALVPEPVDLLVLQARVLTELRGRKERVAEAVVADLLSSGLGRDLARTLGEQAFRHAVRRLARYAEDPSSRPPPRTLFIGHSVTDRRMARLLKETVAGIVPSEVQVFVSSDLDSIKAGEDWLERIIDRLRGCSVMVAIITPNSTGSPWVHYEVGLADAGDPLVIPVTARGGRLSELPAPLGRRQGRNLASAEEAVVLLCELAAELGMGDREPALHAFEELLREARRPILASALSPAALRIAEIMSARSRSASAWDPSLDVEALLREIGVTRVALLAAIAELQELGWVDSREAATGLGLSSIGPAEEFFIDSEAAFGEADPERDARRVAEIVARRPEEASRVTAIARELGWGPRRLNAALHVLRAASPEGVISVDSRGPLAYVLVLPEPRILRLAQGRSIKP